MDDFFINHPCNLYHYSNNIIFSIIHFLVIQFLYKNTILYICNENIILFKNTIPLSKKFFSLHIKIKTADMP